MPIEIRGKRVRVRVKRPIKGAKYRVHDVGQKGHTQRLARQNPRTGKWSTQTWSFPVKDVKERRSQTMKILGKLGVKRKVLKKII